MYMYMYVHACTVFLQYLYQWLFINGTNLNTYCYYTRWLQPDQSVDPNASDLELADKSQAPMVGKQVQLTVRTRDQEKQVVFVDGMNVS